VSEKFQHKKSLGQHFLNSDYVPKLMCDAGAVGAGDTVLEIGPGTGALTRELLARGATVVAIEADERAIAALVETFHDAIARGQLVLNSMDARRIDFETLGLISHNFKIVANIPYYLSGLLFRRCLESDIQPTELVFLVQKEVAERIARSQKESLLSLSVKVFGDPSYICTVKKGHFTPPPAVDSAIVAIRNISRDRLTDHKVTPTQFFEFLHHAFAAKRKQLVGNLADFTGRTKITSVLNDLAIETTVRAEDLSVEQCLAIATKLYTDN